MMEVVVCDGSGYGREMTVVVLEESGYGPGIDVLESMKQVHKLGVSIVGT
jgi:sulfopyruvate decarboxylase TPP-binding subunit